MWGKMKSFSDLKRTKLHIHRLNLIIIVLSGLIAIARFLQTRSTADAWLRGYSLPVLALAGFTLATSAAITLLVVKSCRKRIWARSQLDWLETRQRWRPWCWGLFTLSAMVMMALAVVYDPHSDIPLSSGLLAQLQRARPILMWAAASALQTSLISLLLHRLPRLAESRPEHWFMAAAVISILYTIVLVFQLQVLPSAWAWHFRVPRFQPWLLLAVFLCILTYWLVQATSRIQVNIGLVLAGLLLLGYTLTMVVGLGPARIEQSFNQSRMSVFLRKACQVQGAGNVIRYYENEHTDHDWTSTKPPGLLAFYTLARQALVSDTTLNPQECHRAFSRGMSWLAPLLSALVALPLYLFGRALSGNQAAWLASALYLSSTSFVKFSRFTDAYLYPLLTLLVLAVLYQALHRRSPWWALAAGALTALSAFVSFSLLPLLGAALAWLVLDIASQDKHKRIVGILLLAAFLIGLLLSYGWLYFTYNYNLVLRYQAAMASHTAQKLFQPGVLQVVQSVVVNNLEYAAFSGMALAVLFLHRFWQTFWRKRLGEITLFEGMLLAVSAAYLVTNLIGQTIGEVGRIWMFFTPVLSLVAADAIQQHSQDNRQLLKGVLLLQFGLLLVNCVFLLVLY